MYNTPLVVGVRQYPDWSADQNIEEILIGLGRNTGNFVFTQALQSVVGGAAWGSFGLSPYELEGHDVIVLAAANWVNSFDDFSWLADRLEKTQLPVIMIGLGAQSSLSLEQPVLPGGTLRLLNLVSERSTSIAARGQFTCEVLNKVGIKNVEPIGCPSMLLARPEVIPKQAAEVSKGSDAVCLHATRHGYSLPATLDAYLYRQALQNDWDLLLQSEIPDLLINLGRETSEVIQKAELVFKSAYGVDTERVLGFLRQHGKAFSNFESWIEYARSKSVFVGTRIHGTVAALVAGTPALLIVHDSRTLEMAQSMAIPHIMAEMIDFRVTLRPLELAQAANEQFAMLPKQNAIYRSHYEEFFKRNGLRFVAPTRAI